MRMRWETTPTVDEDFFGDDEMEDDPTDEEDFFDNGVEGEEESEMEIDSAQGGVSDTEGDDDSDDETEDCILELWLPGFYYLHMLIDLDNSLGFGLR